MADKNPLKRQVNEQRKAFKEKHGYPARLIPRVWIGQPVAMNLTGSGSGGQLDRTGASGVLEAVRDDGFIISAGERVVFIPREAVLQMELLEESEESYEDGF